MKLNWFWKWFSILNRKYDHMKDPYRFIVAAAICLPPLFMMARPRSLNQMAVGFAIVVVLILSRMFWTEFLSRKK